VGINGAILMGASERPGAASFQAVEAATGAPMPQLYAEALADDVDAACALAEEAAAGFGALPPPERAAFLDTIPDQIGDLGDLLIATAMAETGLPRARLEGERGRTVGQLRMFCDELRRGRYLDVTIEPALPEHTPPRPDLRRMAVPLGPVAVFGASNFPLAFSAAGGDTAAALAAGCPVIVKGHPAHPGTGELVTRAIRVAVERHGLHEGVFSYLPGSRHELGAALVADRRIRAVGFTGSRAGGLALVEIASARAEPNPVFAEMSSINPVVLMPGALGRGWGQLARGFAASLMLGAGQFCTNPGLVIAIEGEALDAFVQEAASALSMAAPQVMLSPAIRQAYEAAVAALDACAGALRVYGSAPAGACGGSLFRTTASAFLADEALAKEVFGACSLVIGCSGMAEIARVLERLEGQLTATLHLESADEADAAALLPILASLAGRVLVNGWPTGVEVSAAMVHGGPFPATSDGRSTSVGTLAMQRFLRAVCYQGVPDALLPAALKRANPWRLPRLVAGNPEPS
jgi:NADP-dependent aldehyde dehydrogenase